MSINILNLFKVFFSGVVLIILWVFVASSAGVRIDIINNTSVPLNNIYISMENQKVEIEHIGKNNTDSIVFNSNNEVEYFNLQYQDNDLHNINLNSYIEINAAMKITIQISENGKVEVINFQNLLLSIKPIEVFKNYWYRF